MKKFLVKNNFWIMMGLAVRERGEIVLIINYFPMQKFLKMLPRISSVETVPTMVPIE